MIFWCRWHKCSYTNRPRPKLQSLSGRLYRAGDADFGPVEDNKDVRLTMNQYEMGINAHKSDHFDLMLLTFYRLRTCMSSVLSEIDRPIGA